MNSNAAPGAEIRPQLLYELGECSCGSGSLTVRNREGFKDNSRSFA